jgi:hypothetical protein
MATFVPNSTFGRNVLRKVFETEAQQVAVWLLNVPADAPGDRRTWTWADNWKNYRVLSGIAYNTNTAVINLDSLSAEAPSDLGLCEEGVQVSPGAFYIAGPGANNNNQYTYIYNTGTQTLTFTHYAVFVQESAFSSLRYVSNVDQERTNSYLAIVKPYDTETEDPVSLAPQQIMYIEFNFAAPELVGASCNTYRSYEHLVEDNKKYIEDLVNETELYGRPYEIGFAGFGSYSLNRTNSPFLLKAYQNLLTASNQTSSSGFLVELLNVTETEPPFEAPWNTWSTYSINRFAVATPTLLYSYSNEEEFYTIPLDVDTGKVTLTSAKINLSDAVEFLILPPLTSSFTYTHLAVFLQSAVNSPAQGQPYTHTDPDTFVGVIRADSAVTMTSSSTARAYPFNLSLVYNPDAVFEVV